MVYNIGLCFIWYTLYFSPTYIVKGKSVCILSDEAVGN